MSDLSRRGKVLLAVCALIALAALVVLPWFYLLNDARTGVTIDVHSEIVEWSIAPVPGNETVLVLPAGVVFEERWDETSATPLSIVPSPSEASTSFELVGPARLRLKSEGECGLVFEVEPTGPASEISIRRDGGVPTIQTTSVVYSLGIPDAPCPIAPVSFPLLGISSLDIGQQIRSATVPGPGAPPLWFGSTIAGELAAFNSAWLSNTEITVGRQTVGPGDLITISSDVEENNAKIWGIIDRVPAHSAELADASFRIVAQAIAPEVEIVRAGKSDAYRFAPANWEIVQRQPMMLLSWFIFTVLAAFVGVAANLINVVAKSPPAKAIAAKDPTNPGRKDDGPPPSGATS